jgi:hypothetical protein
MAEKYRRSLREFTKAAWPTIEPGVEFKNNWHIDAVSDHLQAVVNGDIKRLIINVPPRHMKSLSVAVLLPAWTWATQPSKKFLYASYAASLSIRDSTKCRRLIDSPWYQAHFGTKFRLTDDQNQKQRFENDATGYRIATSVGGALTGDGGDIICIDDPHNSVEADSAKVREGVLDWWDQAMQTRLNDPKTGAFIIIMQRLHEQDLTGHVLANQLGDEWDHLMLPARYEVGHPTPMKSTLGFTDPRTKEGDLLWPERIDEQTLSNLERSLGSYAAAGQLQQRPKPQGRRDTQGVMVGAVGKRRDAQEHRICPAIVGYRIRGQGKLQLQRAHNVGRVPPSRRHVRHRAGGVVRQGQLSRPPQDRAGILRRVATRRGPD